MNGMDTAMQDRASGSEDMLEAYLSEMAEALDGSTATSQVILAELRDGFLETVEAHLRRGLPADGAVRCAIHAFGQVPEVSRAFAPELAAVRARRLAVRLLGTGPFVGAAWGAALAASRTPVRSVWQGHAGVWTVFPLIGLAVIAAVAAGFLTIMATGRVGRWLPRSYRLAPTAAILAGLSAVVGDVTMLCLVTAQALLDLGTLAPLPIVIAATISLLRVRLTVPATRQCLAARAALV